MTPEEIRLKILGIYVPISAKVGIENGTVLNLAEDAYKFVMKETPAKPIIRTTDNISAPVINGKATSKRKK